MRSASITAPVLIYALVFSFAQVFLVVGAAGVALLETARAPHREAWAQVARLHAAEAPWPELVARVANAHPDDAASIAVVGPDAPALGLTLEDARRLATEGGSSTGGAVRVAEGPEAYVVFKLEPTSTFRRARGALRRLAMIGVLVSATLGTILALLVSRLVLSPLRALREVAADREATHPLAGTESETPNEIADVARTFRRTVRRLREEQDEIERQHKELEAMQGQLIRSSKLASVGRLAAGVAHEIGNPLAAVLGYLEVLKMGLGPAETADVVDRSARELKRIHAIIKKLLAYARADETDEAVRPIATAEVIEDAVDLVRGHPALRGVDLTLELGEAKGAIDGVGRPDALRQVLLNLLINAGQALDGTERPRIVVRRDDVERGVQIEVTDNGPGIAREHLDQIFDPFFTTKAAGEGTGLGLAVSRALMERMGGELEARSEPGLGATFTLRFPRAEPSA